MIDKPYIPQRKYINAGIDPSVIEAENRRLKKQAECIHAQWSKKCACCGLILESDVTAVAEIKSHEQML